jgi:hypothetical protein
LPDGFDAAAAQSVAAAAGDGWLEADRVTRLLRAAGLMLDAGVPPGDATVDVLVGAVNDPELGPVVGVGTGGGRPLVPGDVAFRLVPLTDLDADGLIDAPPAVRAALEASAHDVAALRDVVLRVGALADAVPELAEAELDPVRVGSDSVTIAGARVRLAAPAERSRPKTW